LTILTIASILAIASDGHVLQALCCNTAESTDRDFALFALCNNVCKYKRQTQSANYPLHTFTHLDEIALNGTELFLPWI
jgi:hypothetical protein